MSKESLEHASDQYEMVRMRAPHSGAWVEVPRGLIIFLRMEGWKTEADE